MISTFCFIFIKIIEKQFYPEKINIMKPETLKEILDKLQERLDDFENPGSDIEEHEEVNRILASKRDQKIFVQELMDPSKPNDQLIKAAEKYKNL